MTDFERRVTEALESGAEQAPDATGLAAAARERNRRRVRVRTTGVVAATVLAVAAVSVTVALGRGDGSRSPGVVDTPSSTPTWAAVDPDVRTETYRDLSVEVPSSWGYGSLSTWCLNGKSEPAEPVVERPTGAMPSIGCLEPESGYGAQFFPTALFDPIGDDLSNPWRYEWVPGQVKVYPRDSWLGVVVAGDYAVRVVAPDEKTARRVLDSVRTVDGADANGCAIRKTGTPSELAAGTVSVCRYTQDGWLEQSELLTGADAVAATAALNTAPLDDDLGSGACIDPAPPAWQILIRYGDQIANVAISDTCGRDSGVLVGNEHRLLTQDVMYWALSPGFSGGFDGDVPLPDRLRGQEGPG